MRVSIDTFDPGEIRTAVRGRRRAGAQRQRLEPRGRADLAGSGARVVVLPDLGGALETLEPTPRGARRAGACRYLIDPILEPIGFGFMASLERYAEVPPPLPATPRC